MAKGFIKKVEETANSPFKPFKFEQVGDELTLLFMEVADATSPTYGDFEVVRGLRFNPEAASIEDALASAELVSFPLNTVISNKIKNGAMVVREAYSIKMIWKKGDKYDGNKICKSNGYEVLHLILDDSARQALIAKYNELAGNSLIKDTAPVAEPEAAPAKTPRL